MRRRMRSLLLLRVAFSALIAVLMTSNKLTTAFAPNLAVPRENAFPRARGGSPQQRRQQQQQRHFDHDSSRSSTQLYVFERMSESCVAAVVTAQKQTTQLQLPAVGTEVMMAGCIDHPESDALKRTLSQYRITWRQAQKTLAEMYKDDDDTAEAGWLSGFRAAQQDEERPFDRQLQKTFVHAGKLADQMGSATIQTHHVFLALLEYTEDGNNPTAATVDAETSICHCGAWAVLLKMQTFDENEVAALDICQSLLQHLDENSRSSSSDDRELVTGKGDSKTPTLADVGQDLTQQAMDGLLDPVYGREDEIRACLRTLVRRRKNNVCLIGEAGVGKVRL